MIGIIILYYFSYGALTAHNDFLKKNSFDLSPTMVFIIFIMMTVCIIMPPVLLYVSLDLSWYWLILFLIINWLVITFIVGYLYDFAAILIPKVYDLPLSILLFLIAIILTFLYLF